MTIQDWKQKDACAVAKDNDSNNTFHNVVHLTQWWSEKVIIPPDLNNTCEFPIKINSLATPELFQHKRD